MSDPSDNDLAVCWKNGEVGAYNQLVHRHLDRVHRYVLLRCGNPADADDICQEIFLEVCLKIANFDPHYPFTAWLYTIARNKTADRLRKRPALEVFHPDHHGETETMRPSDPLERREAAAEAWNKVFKLLPDNQATALWLRVQAQMSIEQISSTMDQSLSNVKVLLFRARQTLSKSWDTPATAQKNDSIPSIL